MDAALDLIPLVFGGYLGWTGIGKLADRSIRARAGATALPRLTRGVERAAWLLRLAGLAEIALAAGLLLWPASAVPGLGMAVAGLLFVGYLAYSRAVAPESSCGCTATVHAPISAVDFARASAVVLGGFAATMATQPWWATMVERPVVALASVGLPSAGLALLSVDLRRWRQRLFRHPMADTAGLAVSEPSVPLAATLDLLDRSEAWRSVASVVRSGLLEHWDADGWRILRFAGVRDDSPVSVLFAVDAAATLDNAPDPEIRVSLVDDAAEPEHSPVG